MCGILAHLKKNGLIENDIILALNALQSINHRGPDGEGLIVVNTESGDTKVITTEFTPTDINSVPYSEVDLSKFNLILGHKRLSIFDLSSNGYQPMICKKTGNIIVFNGEVYNWIELKEQLLQKGYSFTTQSDTEVILAAYDFWGEKCIQMFNGMWAIIIYDQAKKSVFASRDRFGVKPLFYSQRGDELIFGSEIKMFLEYPQFKTDYNKPLINYFLNEGLVNFSKDTFYESIFRFPNSYSAGISLSEFELKFKKYYSLIIKKENISFEEAKLKFKELLNDAVKIRMRADVPVGVAVSGGLDSSAIFVLSYNLLKEKGLERTMNTFSVVSPKNEGDESFHIYNLLKNYICLKNEVNPTDNFTSRDFKNHLQKHDNPSTSFSFYADYCLSRLTANHGVKVLLNGQGADEVFAGYHHHFYKYLANLIRELKFKYYRQQINDFTYIKEVDKKKVESAVWADVKLNLKEKLGIKLVDTFGVKNRWLYSKSLDENLLVDLFEFTLPNYLASNDRNTMSFGVESRHPFMDYRLIEFGFSLPDHYKIDKGFQKLIMRESMSELPESIRWRRDKRGFTTPELKLFQLLKEDTKLDLKPLTELGIQFKDQFKYYSLLLWMQKN